MRLWPRHRKSRPRPARPVLVPGQEIPEGYVVMAGRGYAVHRDTGHRIELDTTDLDTALAMGWSRGASR